MVFFLGDSKLNFLCECMPGERFMERESIGTGFAKCPLIYSVHSVSMLGRPLALMLCQKSLLSALKYKTKLPPVLDL
jgi:hypothetical protein